LKMDYNNFNNQQFSSQFNSMDQFGFPQQVPQNNFQGQNFGTDLSTKYLSPKLWKPK
jgi:hypothetical protein